MFANSMILETTMQIIVLDHARKVALSHDTEMHNTRGQVIRECPSISLRSMAWAVTSIIDDAAWRKRMSEVDKI